MKKQPYIAAAYTVMAVFVVVLVFLWNPVQAKERGEGFLGVAASELDDAMYEALDLDEDGLLVNDVVPDGPAEKAGIKPGDVLLEVAGKKMTSSGRLRRVVRSFEPGEKVDVKIWRDGKQMTLNVELGDKHSQEHLGYYPSAPDVPGFFGDDDAIIKFTDREPNVWLGVHVDDLSEQLGDYFGVKDGDGVLVTEVEEDAPAEKAGIKAGDVIISLDGKKIENVETLIDELDEYSEGDKVEVEVRRKGKKKSFEVTLEENEEETYYFQKTIKGPGIWKMGDSGHLFEIVKDLNLDNLEKLKDLDRLDDTEELRAELEELKAELQELKEKVEK